MTPNAQHNPDPWQEARYRPDPAACPGRCNRKYRGLWRDYSNAHAAFRAASTRWLSGSDEPAPIEPDPPTWEPWWGEPIWCPRDVADIRQHLAELSDLASMYAAEADGHREAPTDSRVSGSAEPSSPSPVLDDLDELAGWLRDWESAYTGTDPIARRGLLADSVYTGVAFLLARLDRMLALPDVAVDFGNEVLGWHKRLVGKTKAGAQVHRMQMRCPGCQSMSLEWTDGTESVVCIMRDCGRILRLGEYRDLAEEQTRAMSRAAS